MPDNDTEYHDQPSSAYAEGVRAFHAYRRCNLFVAHFGNAKTVHPENAFRAFRQWPHSATAEQFASPLPEPTQQWLRGFADAQRSWNGNEK